MIEPFFFSDERIFGCYHPSSESSSTRMLIICPPLFDEYRRSYKALADLANACATQGVHVLRFDYFGTGESFGSLEDARLSDWISDIDASIDEGIALTGAEHVVLAGVRFGATLAAQSRHSGIRRYVFWDPVASGAVYLDWLSSVNERLEAGHKWLSRYFNVKIDNLDYENFHLVEELKTGIRQIVFSQKECDEAAESHVITTSKQIFDSGIFSNCEFPGLEYDWPPYHDGVLTHKPVLEAIARKVLEH